MESYPRFLLSLKNQLHTHTGTIQALMLHLPHDILANISAWQFLTCKMHFPRRHVYEFFAYSPLITVEDSLDNLWITYIYGKALPTQE